MVSLKKLFATAFAVFGVAAFTGCGNSSPSVSISPSSAILLPSQTLQFSTVSNGTATSSSVWQVNGVKGGSESTGTITSGGVYTAPGTTIGQPIQVGVQGLTGVAEVTIFDPVHFTPGSVATTQNPLVGAYTISAPAGSSVHVQFGPDTGYAYSTSVVPAENGGGPVTVLVAGMKATTTYHLQAVVDLIDGSHLVDSDHPFTTGAVPAGRLPALTAQAGVGTPSSGIELLSLRPDANDSNLLSTVATDLQGNVIWYYDLETDDWPFPIKPLPNGHMLVVAAPVQSTGINEVREIDLAGNIINSISPNQVNAGLSGVASFQVDTFHHDVTALPNGHLILLGEYSKIFNNLSGVPPGTSVQGDVLIDWDPQRGPVWTWSTFDHLDPSRAPYGIQNGVEDWTHANAVIYSKDDGNLIVSLRNQNWILKIDYRDGAGDGNILWRFGVDGDFTLPGGQTPMEWNYGQHYPTIVSPNSAGLFSLMFFNNGNNRLMDSNSTVCGTPGVVACYSSVPIFQLDEFAKTATVTWEDNLAPFYSVCCGDALLLPNGNLEYDIAFDAADPTVSHIQEVTQTATPQLVWKMDVRGQLAYRGFRIPSLYPGEVWPAAVPTTPKAQH